MYLYRRTTLNSHVVSLTINDVKHEVLSPPITIILQHNNPVRLAVMITIFMSIIDKVTITSLLSTTVLSYGVSTILFDLMFLLLCTIFLKFRCLFVYMLFAVCMQVNYSEEQVVSSCAFWQYTSSDRWVDAYTRDFKWLRHAAYAT